ncbi:COG3415 family protein [Desulfobacter sp.]
MALKQYFDRTADDLEEQGELSAQRVSNALGFGLSTVRKTMADYNRGVDFDKESVVYRGRPQRALSDSTQTIVREYIRNANKEGAYMTLETLWQYLEEVAPEQEFSIRTLGRALDRWGFTFSCKKEKIRSWLEKNNFPVKEDCLKAELVDILTKVGPQPTYSLKENS